MEDWKQQRERLDGVAQRLEDCTLLMATGERCSCTEDAAAIRAALVRLDLLEKFTDEVLAITEPGEPLVMKE